MRVYGAGVPDSQFNAANGMKPTNSKKDVLKFAQNNGFTMVRFMLGTDWDLKEDGLWYCKIRYDFGAHKYLVEEPIKAI
jgi:hypothetical protein